MKITQPVTSLCIITVQKSLIDLKSTQNITLKYLGLYAKHSLHKCKCSFYYFALYSITSVVVFCLSNKVEYLDQEGSYTNSTQEVV